MRVFVWCIALLVTVSPAYAQFEGPPPMMSPEMQDAIAAKLKRHGWEMEIPFHSSLIEYREAADRAQVHGPTSMRIPELRMENAALIRTEKDFGNVELLLEWTWAAHHDKETDHLEVRLREKDEQCIIIRLYPDTGKCTIFAKEGEVVTELASNEISYRDGNRHRLDPDKWTIVGIRDMNGVISVYIAASDGKPEYFDKGYNPKRPVVQAKYDKTKFTKGKVVVTDRQIGRPEVVAGMRVETFVRSIDLVARK